MKKKLILKFLFFYFLITTFLVTIYILQYEKNVIAYLDTKTSQHLLEFRAIYNKYKALSNLIFDTDINTDKTLNIFKDAYKSNTAQKNLIREELFNQLEQKYEKLKRYNLQQLHFHLPNNESFLRMHRPNRYGDNLTDIRSTVKYVNEYKKYIDGFEEGKVINGFRFVYPLFTKQNDHIGSVEISFSVLAMIESMNKSYDLNLSFLIRKDIVDKKLFKDELKNYIQSPDKNFYYEKTIYDKYPPLNRDFSSNNFTNVIIQKEPFTIFNGKQNITETLIPIQNPVSKEIVAVLSVSQYDKFISNDKNELTSKIITTYLILALLFYLFYKQTLSKAELVQLNKDLDKRVSLEVKRGRKQDLHIFNQSKMASIGRMITNISHQWRQPLSVITTCASGLKVQKEMNLLNNEDFESFTNSILEQSKYLSKTLDSFREYIETNDKQKTPFSVQIKMDKVINFLAPIFEEHNIKITKRFEKNPLLVLGIKAELFEIFNAILTNAKDAFEKNSKEENKEIVITIKQKDEYTILITISDNAGGINQEFLDKIFDPYFTTKHESVGTGISLYLTYKLVTENFRGDIFVKNRNNGAKFYIELPLYNS